MRPLRYLLIMLTAVMLLAPTALAAGPSAGDQQYTDPLGGSNGTSNNSSSSGSSSGSSTPASSSSSSSGTSTSASSPTSTTSSAPTATTAQANGGSLPRTGFNAWLGAAFGVVLLAAGLAVRRQMHRRPSRRVHGRYIR